MNDPKDVDVETSIRAWNLLCEAAKRPFFTKTNRFRFPVAKSYVSKSGAETINDTYEWIHLHERGDDGYVAEIYPDDLDVNI